MRRYDQRNTSDKNSAYAALISNITEKDRAQDVEQFDDILRTLINDMNKFENRFGKIRDEEKMLAVKKLMPERLLNYRYRGTTMSYSEVIIALENVIVDKEVTVPPSKNRRNLTSAPMEIGMAAREDGESASQEGRSENCGFLVAGCLQKNRQRTMEIRQRSKVERERRQRWEGWTKEFVAEGQRQESRKRARNGCQRRFQNMLDVR